MNLAALAFKEAARRHDKVVTTKVVSAISQESGTSMGKGAFLGNNRRSYYREKRMYLWKILADLEALLWNMYGDEFLDFDEEEKVVSTTAEIF